MATLQVTAALHVTPLVDIRTDAFAQSYATGVGWRLFGWRKHGEIEAQGALPDSFLMDNLKICSKGLSFDGHHEEQIQRNIGYFIGMLHGGMLTPDGTLRPDVITLVILNNQEFARGYDIGRDYFFNEAGLDERTMNSDDLIARIRDLVEAHPYSRENNGLWNYILGCIVGELSGHLFPATPEEQQRWEADRRKWEQICEQQEQRRATEPLPVVASQGA